MSTDQRRSFAGQPGPAARGGLGTSATHAGPPPGPAAPPPVYPAYVVTPQFVPYEDGDGAMVMSVAGGGVRRLSKRASHVVIAAIVFATCVVPLVIAAIVYLSMPDVDSMFEQVQVPSVTVESP
jgi:hypothetical protein